MSTSDDLFAQFQRVLPHHALSRVVHRVARWETPLMQPLLRQFVRRYGLRMDEAADPDLTHYRSFNALFTRALRPGCRPLDDDVRTVLAPADALVGALGRIEAGQIFQAKGHQYTVTELFGGFTDLAEPFQNGSFATVYLSPRDYHRVHMPLDGRLGTMLHVPGRLFSVAPRVVARIPRLFARNERVVALFETVAGPMALALIGAVNVGSIETVWAGEITPPHGSTINRRDYPQREVALQRGAEMGRFNLGSSVILLFGEGRIQLDPLQPGARVRVGARIGRLDPGE